jgi:hypothetical protein
LASIGFLFFLFSPTTLAQSPGTAIQIANQEIEEALVQGQVKPAVDRILELLSLEDGKSSVSLGDEREGFRLRWPITRYWQDRLLRNAISQPQLLTEFRRRVDPLAQRKLRESGEGSTATSTRELADRYLASSWGTELLLKHAEVASQEGKFSTAELALSRVAAKWQAVGQATEIPFSLPWSLVLAEMDSVPDQVKQLPTRVPLLTAGDDPTLSDAEIAARLTASIHAQRVKEKTKRFASHPKGFARTPVWSVALPDSRPFSPHPQVWDDKLLVPTSNALRAYRLEDGTPWPIESRSVPLFASNLSDKDQFLPTDFPSQGMPHQSLSIFGGTAIFRYGNPVTGWLPTTRRDWRPRSYVAAIDLNAEGRLLKGFPWHPGISGWEGMEVEGSPTLVGDHWYVGLLRRNATGMDSFVGCLDLMAQARWLAGPLNRRGSINEPPSTSKQFSQATPSESSTTLRVSHARVAWSEGVLYYQASLGSLVALDAEKGTLLWMLEYPQDELGTKRSGRQRSNMETRDMMTVLVSGPLVYAAPADCDRVFAARRDTGQLVWATPAGEALDAGDFLGSTAEYLILSGHRLYWIDRVDGQILATVPEDPWQPSTVGQRPGRGVLMGDLVCIPVKNQLRIFDTKLDEHGEPRLRQQIPLGQEPLQVRSLMATDDGLVVATESKIAYYRP